MENSAEENAQKRQKQFSLIFIFISYLSNHHTSLHTHAFTVIFIGSRRCYPEIYEYQSLADV